MQAVIGALRTVLSTDSAAFEKGLNEAVRKLRTTQRKFEKFGRGLTRAGRNISIGISAPLAAVGAASFQAGVKHREAMAQVEAGLKSMGGASGKSLDGLKKQALALESLSTFNADDVLKTVTANMLTFGNVSGEVFDRAQQVTLDLSTRLDQDLKSSAIQVGKALNDPVLGLTALSRVGIQFSEDQKKVIKGLVEEGKVAEAQGLILEELERQYAGSAKAARDAAPGSDTADAWRKTQRIIGNFVVEVLEPLQEVLGRVLNRFNNLSPGIQRTILVVGGLTAALGPALLALGTMVTIFAPVFAANITIAGTAMSGFGIATSVALGPVSLMAAAIIGTGGLVYALGRWSSASETAKRAHGDLYKLINESKSLREADKALTLEQAEADLEGARAKREQIKALIQEKKLLLEKQQRAFEILSRSSSGDKGGADLSALRKLTATKRAIADANAEILNQEGKILDIQKNISELKEKSKTRSSTPNTTRVLSDDAETEIKRVAELRKSKAREIAEAHTQVVESTNDDIQSIKALTAAMRESRQEYDITKIQLDLLSSGYLGGADAALELAKTVYAANQELANAESQEQARIAHDQTVASIRREIESNKDLAAAAAISRREYEIVSETLRILQTDFQGTREEARQLAIETVDSAKQVNDALGNVGSTGRNSFDSVASSFQGFARSLKSDDILGTIQSILSILEQIGNIDFGGSGTGGKGLGGILKGITSVLSIFGGKRERGGPTQAGKTYLVGERGPELFTSPGAGRIVPNHQLMGGMVTIAVQANDYFEAKVASVSTQTATPIAAGMSNAAVTGLAKRQVQASRRQL